MKKLFFSYKNPSYQLTVYFRDLLYERLPSFMVPGNETAELRRWWFEIDRLAKQGCVFEEPFHQADAPQHRVDEIQKVIDWAIDHPFWGPVIHDPYQLRKHFRTMYSQMARARKMKRSQTYDSPTLRE
jgi:hypothetical protein